MESDEDIFSSGEVLKTPDENRCHDPQTALEESINRWALDNKTVTCRPRTAVPNKQPYIYYRVKDLLNFTDNNKPMNCKFRLIGTYTEESVDEPFLIEAKSRIALNLRLVRAKPNVDETVEVFGCLGCVNGCEASEFVVQIWRYRSGDVERYRKSMMLLNEFALGEFKDVTKLNFDCDSD